MSGPIPMVIDEARLRSLYDADATWNELARAFGCSVGPIRKAIRRLGLARSRRGVRVRDPQERFWEKVEKTDGCWNWTSALDLGGYGLHWIGNGISRRAHRLAYSWIIGPIPEGLTLDHLCKNRRCVNPAHLEPVTASENSRRAAPPHCRNGHAFRQGSFFWRGPRRICIECRGSTR